MTIRPFASGWRRAKGARHFRVHCREMAVSRSSSPVRLASARAGRAPRAHGDATRARLLEIAGQLFAQRGYAGVASKTICEQAGTDLAAINYHFGGRDGLYQAVLMEGYNSLMDLESLTAIVNGSEPPEEKLGQIIDRLVERAFDDQGWYSRVFAREIVAPSPHFEALARQGMMPRFGLFSQILAQITGLPAEDPAILRCSVSIIGPCLMMLVVDPQAPSLFTVLRSRPAADLKQHLKLFALAGLHAVRAAESPRA